MEIRNPIETLIGAKGTAKVAGLSLLDLDSMTLRELRRHGLKSDAGREGQGSVRAGPATA